MSNSSKLDEAWNKIFSDYDILAHLEDNDSVYEISAETIKHYREPRLMTKFDWSASRPKLFKENELSILPNSRGTYIIGRFKAYQPLEFENIKPISVYKPDWIRSFDDFNITSESVALNLAQMSGMVDIAMGTKLGEPQALETITGRLKSGVLNYDISIIGSQKKHRFSVENAQIEIDAGFENINNLAVIEAKNHMPDDFIIRQLYYPYVVYNQLNSGKNVIPMYVTYADNIFAFHIFGFKKPNDYSSITQIKQINFIIDENLDITLENVKKINSESLNIEEPSDIPYPQADNLTRVLDILQYLDTPKNNQELAEEYNFDIRQSDYYGNALRYLGLARKNENRHLERTSLGTEIANMPNNNSRNKKVIRQILSHTTFHQAFEFVMRNNGQYENDYIADLLLKTVPTINSKSTAYRRSSTVTSWISWILDIATAQ